MSSKSAKLGAKGKADEQQAQMFTVSDEYKELQRYESHDLSIKAFKESSQDKRDLQKDITKIQFFLHNKAASFEERLKFVLMSTYHDPDIIPYCGIFWVDNYIVANPTILAKFMNIKTNSINCNFKQHQFKRIYRVKHPFVNSLPDSRNWSFFIHIPNKFKKEDILQGKKNLLKWEKPIKIEPNEDFDDLIKQLFREEEDYDNINMSYQSFIDDEYYQYI